MALTFLRNADPRLAAALLSLLAGLVTAVLIWRVEVVGSGPFRVVPESTVVTAPGAGFVEGLRVQRGDAVGAGQPVAVLQEDLGCEAAERRALCQELFATSSRLARLEADFADRRRRLAAGAPPAPDPGQVVRAASAELVGLERRRAALLEAGPALAPAAVEAARALQALGARGGLRAPDAPERLRAATGTVTALTAVLAERAQQLAEAGAAIESARRTLNDLRRPGMGAASPATAAAAALDRETEATLMPLRQRLGQLRRALGAGEATPFARWSAAGTILLSPVAGLVSSVAAPIGTPVAAGLPVLRVQRNGAPLEIEAYVDGRTVRRLAPGSRGRLSFEALDPEMYPAPVAVVREVSRIPEAQGLYRLRLALSSGGSAILGRDGRSMALSPGMVGEVRFHLESVPLLSGRWLRGS